MFPTTFNVKLNLEEEEEKFLSFSFSISLSPLTSFLAKCCLKFCCR
jgi:hypothetical protein